METNVKVSISGFAFNLNEDAHKALKAYLDELKQRFSTHSEGVEVLQDIEARVAELLMGDMQTEAQVVNLTQVERVIATLGTPDELAGEGSKDSQHTQKDERGYSAHNPAGSRQRRLYRDVDNQKIAGVCAGIAAYFNIDPVFIRIALILLIFGFSIPFVSGGGVFILVYVVLWAALPKATTIVQKLEMKGETPTVANVERRMREDNQTPRRRSSAIGNIIKYSIIGLGIMILLPIAIGMLAVLFAVVVTLFVSSFVVNFSLVELGSFIELNSTGIILSQVFLALTIIIPILLLLYAIIKLIFRFKTKVKGLVGISIIVWFVSIIGLCGSIGNMALDFRKGAQATTEQKVEAHSTLAIKLPEGFENRNEEVGFTNTDASIPHLWVREDGETLSIIPVVEVKRKSTATQITVKQESYARGKNKKLAREHLQNIPQCHSLSDSTLTILPMVFSKDKGWKGEFVKITIYVPDSTQITTDPILESLKGYKNSKRVSISLKDVDIDF